MGTPEMADGSVHEAFTTQASRIEFGSQHPDKYWAGQQTWLYHLGKGRDGLIPATD